MTKRRSIKSTSHYFSSTERCRGRCTDPLLPEQLAQLIFGTQSIPKLELNESSPAQRSVIRGGSINPLVGRQNTLSSWRTCALFCRNPSVKTLGNSGHCRARVGLISSEKFSQLVFGARECALSAFGQILAGAIDVKIQHRHRRLIRLCLPTFAPLRRAFQRERDFSRAPGFENAGFQVERIAPFRNSCGPTLVSFGFFSRHFGFKREGKALAIVPW